MSKILITGGSGYIGQHLLKRLLSEKSRSIVLLRGKNSHVDRRGNITYYDYHSSSFDMYKMMKQEKPDIVIHLAGYFLGEHTASDITKLLDSNIRFGVVLLDAMAQADIHNLINTGSYWEYYRQNGIYHPVNLYAALKRAFKDIIQFYVEAYSLNVMTLQLYDIYGVGDPRNKLIPSLFMHRHTNVPFPMSPGRQYVDFVYMSDVIDAYMAAIEYVEKSKKPFNETVEIGSGNPIRLDRFITLFEEVCECSVMVEFGKRPYRKREVMHACADINKAKRLLHWEPKVTLEAGLRMLKSAINHD